MNFYSWQTVCSWVQTTTPPSSSTDPLTIVTPIECWNRRGCLWPPAVNRWRLLVLIPVRHSALTAGRHLWCYPVPTIKQCSFAWARGTEWEKKNMPWQNKDYNSAWHANGGKNNCRFITKGSCFCSVCMPLLLFFYFFMLVRAEICEAKFFFSLLEGKTHNSNEWVTMRPHRLLFRGWEWLSK